jgi:glycosyltransferase involved in cell wall biosynthesis
VSPQDRGSLKVAFLNPYYWPEVRRGSERVIHDLAVDLQRLGHRIRLITSHTGRPQRSVEEGLEIIRNWRPPELPLRLRNFQEALTHVPMSYLSLRRGSDDLAHAFFPTDALAAIQWAELTGRPAVFSYMGVPQRSVLSSKRLRLRILERVTTRSDAIVVLTKAARDGMWKWLGVEPRLIYPGVDLDLFTQGDERAPHPTIACVADAADARKQVGLLVDAFHLVRKKLPDARLLLSKPSDARLESIGAQEGIELFDLDSQQVASVYRRAWVSGLASYKEAFGLVLVEALACGTPVFGRRDGGVPEIIDRDEVGRLFDGDDPKALASAILETLQLATDPSTASACRSRAQAFDKVHTAHAYEALYRELLQGG